MTTKTVGIDLGTTNSVIAAMEGSQAVVSALPEGRAPERKWSQRRVKFRRHRRRFHGGEGTMKRTNQRAAIGSHSNVP